MMARFVEVTLGIPKLGIIKEIYNMDDPGDCQAWDTNVANGCSTLIIKQLGHLDPRKGTTMNEEITNPGTEADTAAAAPLTDAEVAAILASKPVFAVEADEVTTDETVH